MQKDKKINVVLSKTFWNSLSIDTSCRFSCIVIITYWDWFVGKFFIPPCFFVNIGIFFLWNYYDLWFPFPSTAWMMDEHKYIPIRCELAKGALQLVCWCIKTNTNTHARSTIRTGGHCDACSLRRPLRDKEPTYTNSNNQFPRP